MTYVPFIENKITKSEYRLLKDEIIAEFPEFKIVHKQDSNLMKTIDVLLRIATLNQMKTFLANFTTTIGSTVYVSNSWKLQSRTSKWTTLSHERVHLEQFKRYGKFGFGFLYILCLPVFFAYYRTKFEKEAYKVSMRCKMQTYGPEKLFSHSYREMIISYFTSSAYFWMWVKRSDIENWYDNVVDQLLDEEGLTRDEFLFLI